MTPETFCEQFATFAEAPNGVAKLRELILQLAVQGKLGTQDVNDEPASAVIARITNCKSEMLDGGEIQRDKKFAPIAKQEPPWPIPQAWVWVRLQDIFEISRGGSPRPAGDPQYFGGPIPWITVGEITKDDDLFLTQTSNGLTELGSQRSRFVEPDDLLITNSGATLGVPKITQIRGCINDGVALLKCFHSEVVKAYAYLFLRQQTPAFRNVNQGMGQPNLNTPILAGWYFAFPPLAEQRRIVGKVDQLLGLCDELAARQAARREARSALVGATLDRLVSARSAAEFPAHAHRLRDHFDRLFDTPTTLPQLRQAILQLAVQGQIVPQDPNDEPASVSHRDADAADVVTRADNRPAFDIPTHWRWVTVDEVADSRLGKMLDKAKNKGKPFAYLRNTNVHWFRFELTSVKEMPFAEDELDEFEVHPGDVLICEGGHGIGRTAVWNGDLERVMFQKALHRVRPSRDLDGNFFAYCMRVYDATGVLQTHYTGAGIPHLTGRSLAKIAFPLPPLSEQKRIVSKVTELLSLCDALEAKLTQAESASTQLLSAAVAHLLTRSARVS